jgi:type II secretory pathway component PulF
MESAGRLKALPSMAAATMDAAAQLGQLPEAVDSLCMLARQQAEMRLASISTVLSPLLIMVVGAAMVVAMLVVLVPMLAMFNALSGG